VAAKPRLSQTPKADSLPAGARKSFTIPKRGKQTAATTAPLKKFVTSVDAPELAATMDSLSQTEVSVKDDVIYREHLFQTFQAMKFVKQLPPADTTLLKGKT
jgi:hypothetical protein